MLSAAETMASLARMGSSSEPGHRLPDSLDNPNRQAVLLERQNEFAKAVLAAGGDDEMLQTWEVVLDRRNNPVYRHRKTGAQHACKLKAFMSQCLNLSQRGKAISIGATSRTTPSVESKSDSEEEEWALRKQKHRKLERARKADEPTGSMPRRPRAGRRVPSPLTPPQSGTTSPQPEGADEAQPAASEQAQPEPACISASGAQSPLQGEDAQRPTTAGEAQEYENGAHSPLADDDEHVEVELEAAQPSSSHGRLGRQQTAEADQGAERMETTTAPQGRPGHGLHSALEVPLASRRVRSPRPYQQHLNQQPQGSRLGLQPGQGDGSRVPMDRAGSGSMSAAAQHLHMQRPHQHRAEERDSEALVSSYPAQRGATRMPERPTANRQAHAALPGVQPYEQAGSWASRPAGDPEYEQRFRHPYVASEADAAARPQVLAGNIRQSSAYATAAEESPPSATDHAQAAGPSHPAQASTRHDLIREEPSRYGSYELDVRPPVADYQAAKRQKLLSARSRPPGGNPMYAVEHKQGPASLEAQGPLPMRSDLRQHGAVANSMQQQQLGSRPSMAAAGSSRSVAADRLVALSNRLVDSKAKLGSDLEALEGFFKSLTSVWEQVDQAAAALKDSAETLSAQEGKIHQLQQRLEHECAARQAAEEHIAAMTVELALQGAQRRLYLQKP